MRGAEGIVFGLGAFGEAGEPAALTKRVHLPAAAGEDFVRVGLVADIPDEFVSGRVEHGVDGDGELDDAEAGAEVAAGFGDGLNHVAAEFFGEDFQFGVAQRFHVGGDVNAVKKGVRLGRGVMFRGLFHRPAYVAQIAASAKALLVY